MSSKKITCACLVCAAALAACSNNNGTGGGGNDLNNDGGEDSGHADGSGAPLDCEHIDYSSYGKGETVSFRDDLLPIFGFSCVLSDCHNSDKKAAGLYLGHKCAYDTTAKWDCRFPTTAPSDPLQPAPDDDQTIMDVYTSLLGNSETVTSPTVARVAPGDPANSFLILKLANQQNSKGYTCTNTDPSHESSPPPCGVSMPQNADLFCQGTSRVKFDAVAEWIAQGAKNN